MKIHLRTQLILLLILFGVASPVCGDDVIFIDIPGPTISIGDTIAKVCHFYGLKLRTISSVEELNRLRVKKPRLEDLPAAVIVLTNSLIDIRVKEAIKELRTAADSPTPLLLFDIDSTTDGSILQEFSAGAITATTALRETSKYTRYRVMDVKPITQELRKQAFDVAPEVANVLQLNPYYAIQGLIYLSANEPDLGLPIFAAADIVGRKVFFQTRFKAADSPYVLRPGLKRGNLFEILPLLMFLRYACEERCWRYPGYFANLIIDDPWLTEPYGYLRYGALVQEMREHRFHTTIAFVPWNYDRSESAVVSLFHEHADKLSVCVHGDNHDHKEFIEGKTGYEQESDILQGLARMEEFTRLTGILYDRVMVFPHSIGPIESLEILKKNNFLGTVNLVNVPEGESRPPDIFSNLRTISMDFAGFPSIARSNARKVTKSDIALDLFLGNPILLYSHHDLFRSGMDAFNSQAAMINELEPSIRWASLGAIARHLYLLRKRTDGNIDVTAFSRSIELNNPHSSTKTYYIRRVESFSVPLAKVTVDGSVYPYDKTEEGILLVLEIPARSRRSIIIEYDNTANLNDVDIRKNDRRVNRLRKISDFRDISLSSNIIGRFIIDLYYSRGRARRIAFIGLVIFIVLSLVVWRFLKLRRKRRK